MHLGKHPWGAQLGGVILCGVLLQIAVSKVTTSVIASK